MAQGLASFPMPRSFYPMLQSAGPGIDSVEQTAPRDFQLTS
jgi:hypothetical protein